LPEKRLQERSGKEIQAFLADLAKRPGVADWQVSLYHHDLHPRIKPGLAVKSPADL